MITFFTIPKPFTGIYSIIQKNAIRSWKQLNPSGEIFIFGDDSTVVEFAREESIRCFSELELNEYGTPLLPHIYKTAIQESSFKRLCFINSDIILFPDFISKIEAVSMHNALIAGRRWDLDYEELIDFCPSWVEDMKAQVKVRGKLHRETGVDYFLFAKDLAPEMPKFAIGRGWWDNWLLYNFISRGIPLVDATEIMTVHQNHDYSHVKSTTQKTTSKGLELLQNKAEAKLPYWKLFYISDATHELQNEKLVKASFLKKTKRLYERYIVESISVLKILIKKLIGKIR